MRIERSSLVIHVARLLVVAVNLGDVVLAVANLAKQLTILAVEIKVHVTIAVGRHQDIVLANADSLHSLFLHILGHALLNQQLRQGAARVDRVEIEHVLMTVHGVNQYLLGILGRQDAGHVAILIHRNLQLLGLVALDIVAPSRHLRVVLASLRVLVAIITGIQLKLLLLRFHALIQLQRVLLHLRLVELEPAQHRTIGVEGQRAVERKLLLVNPIGNAIDDLVKLTIGSDLTFAVVVEQLHQEDVVVAHESHLVSIGRPYGHLLRTSC